LASSRLFIPLPPLRFIMSDSCLASADDPCCVIVTLVSNDDETEFDVPYEILVARDAQGNPLPHVSRLVGELVWFEFYNNSIQFGRSKKHGFRLAKMNRIQTTPFEFR